MAVGSGCQGEERRGAGLNEVEEYEMESSGAGGRVTMVGD